MSEQFNPEQMPHEDIIEGSEEMRLHMAQELGLPQDASWDDVITHKKFFCKNVWSP